MAGSGLQEMFETVYAPGTFPHMISGHAYTRAFRGQLIAALLSILLQHGNIKLDDHQDVLTDLLAGAEKPSESNSYIFRSLLNIISTIMTENFSDSRTLRLWKSYLRMTHIVRLFMFAERTGHFALHLYCMKQFIPIFHATGHFACAKYTRRYIQQMASLKDVIPEKKSALYTQGGFSQWGERIFLVAILVI